MKVFSRIPVFVWFLLVTLILVVGGVFIFWRLEGKSSGRLDSNGPIAVSKPVEGTVEYPIMGREHIAQGTAGSGYNSNPPSSGPHWPNPAAEGVYDSSLRDEQLIHDFEHGYVWVAYKPDIPAADVSKLRDVIKADGWKIVMAPRDKNDSMIALVSWGRVLKMDSLDEQKVKGFIRTYRNRGPENTPG